MKVLIVGLGSIGQKHIKALRQIHPDVEIFALRSSKLGAAVNGVCSIYAWEEAPKDLKFVIISNPTSEHKNTICHAVNLGIPIFLEKPPFMSLDGINEILLLVDQNGIPTYTAFNLRFYPVIQWLKDNLPVEKVLEVQAYCGSYLPDWRKEQDYRKNYSSIKGMGGGVHLDLIHELDYLVWIFGMPASIDSFLSKISELEISSIDSAHYWLAYNHMNVSIILNYFRRDPKRSLEIVMIDDTWNVNLLIGVISNSKGGIVFSTDYKIVDSYVDQLKYFLECIDQKKALMNNLNESVQTLKLCLHDT
jgi:predicted dehydrogenase